MKLAELPFWFTGTALEICRQYDDAKDLDAAFVKIKQHLRREFSQPYKDALTKPDKPAKSAPPSQPAHTPPKKKDETMVWICSICKKPYHFHSAEHCKVFLAMNLNDRMRTSRKHNCCINCLKPSHSARDCTHPKCRKCLGAHYELLHPQVLTPTS